MWVLNVGALKPLEMDIEYFLRYGWEADRETSLTKDTRHFVSEWINDNFLVNMETRYHQSTIALHS